MNRQELTDHEPELGFVPQDCVRWLSPTSLVRIGVKVLMAEQFANFGDKRELQAVFDPGVLPSPVPDQRGDVWIDFTADTGDGFDATYSVALLLAQPELQVDATACGEGSAPITLPRGDVLVLGGDEVYPTPSRKAYEDRTTGPFSAALPEPDPTAPAAAERPAPMLLALPGNHDWYDGLTAFLRVFTAQARIGGWRTVQTRSYFAMRLAPGWWIAGLDSQLSEYIDTPQLDYFHQHLSSQLAEGDAVILCSAAPSWVQTAYEPDAFNQLHFFEKNYVRHRYNRHTQTSEPTGAAVRLWISGDSHHYCRFEESLTAGPEASPDPRAAQLVTCGLGGAFLSATHRLPGSLTLPPAHSRMRTKDAEARTYLHSTSYPDAATSRRLSRRIAMPWSPAWLPTRNPWFGLSMGAIHLALFGLLIWLLSAYQGGSVGDAVRSTPASTGALFALVVLSLPLLPVVATGVTSVLRGADWPVGKIPTLLAVCFQLVVAGLLILIAVSLPWPSDWPTGLVLLGTAVLAAVGGSALGSQAFALFVLVMRSGEPVVWQMAGQAIEHHKGFLRLRLSESGDLVVYPLAADRICEEWELDDVRPGLRRPVPVDGLPAVRLVEAPFTISREGWSSDVG